jgi:hypothetical protein
MALWFASEREIICLDPTPFLAAVHHLIFHHNSIGMYHVFMGRFAYACSDIQDDLYSTSIQPLSIHEYTNWWNRATVTSGDYYWSYLDRRKENWSNRNQDLQLTTATR